MERVVIAGVIPFMIPQKDTAILNVEKTPLPEEKTA